MGTRALTFVYDEDGEAIINMYSQYDGYPEGHGSDIAHFLRDKRLVNGMAGDTSMVFNGMGCLAASLVAYFKDSAGGFYLYPASAKDCGQDYEYHIYKDKIVIKNFSERDVFSGSWEEFAYFCNATVEETE